ncbi:hypothetical protein [Streptomyces sp. Y2F8-2]|uniref:hypothetical protein n=1 Tax=unclassified Streptomyces TaxID=2593676 RepID=UPI00190576D3|nr:hypothetical protein [Streptomyces sp. Y2F8-2]
MADRPLARGGEGRLEKEASKRAERRPGSSISSSGPGEGRLRGTEVIGGALTVNSPGDQDVELVQL